MKIGVDLGGSHVGVGLIDENQIQTSIWLFAVRDLNGR